jgi:hypothetical protein
MNYSKYFENKVAAILSNEFNLITVETDNETKTSFIVDSILVNKDKLDSLLSNKLSVGGKTAIMTL